MKSETTAFVGGMIFTLLASAVVADGVKSQLEWLAAVHHFELSGQTQLEGVPAVEAEGEIGVRINRMLSGFNHVVIHAPNGEVSRVVVLGAKQTTVPLPDRIIVNTHRLGSHHTLNATLIGENGVELDRRLIVDTGSTFVVLPRSLITELDLDPATLNTHELKTVAGSVTAQLGNLYALRIGGREIRDVAAAFVADAELGENLLLGMSLLKHFAVTFDDQQQRLILISNQ